MSQIYGKFIKQSEIVHQNISGTGYYNHAAIDAFINAGGTPSFSFNYIEQDITVPLYQQMAVHGTLTIGTGDLIVIGEVAIV